MTDTTTLNERLQGYWGDPEFPRPKGLERKKTGTRNTAEGSVNLYRWKHEDSAISDLFAHALISWSLLPTITEHAAHDMDACAALADILAKPEPLPHLLDWYDTIRKEQS